MLSRRAFVGRLAVGAAAAARNEHASGVGELELVAHAERVERWGASAQLR
jgi:hypothetical protein